jgi:branched-subunit amino acid ABC-type transport system permease component
MVVSMCISGIYGFAVERVAYRPLRHAPMLSPLISAIGMSILLQNFVRIGQGPAPVYFPDSEPYAAAFKDPANNMTFGPYAATFGQLLIAFLVMLVIAEVFLWLDRRKGAADEGTEASLGWPRTIATVVRWTCVTVLFSGLLVGFLSDFFLETQSFDTPLGEALVTPLDFFIMALCIVLMGGLYAFVQTTRLGKAMRATSEDKVMAGLVGISINRVISITFVIGSMLAAVAGVLLTLFTTQAKYDMGFMAGMKAFTAAVLGGIGNLRGAMLGGVVLGLAEAIGIQFFGADYKEVYAFVVLLIILVVRPKGILGERVAEKV